jgi:thiol-disulfide isomerase/thioredoxin
MIPLTDQLQFEELYFGRDPNVQRFLVWFSAKWCGPCQRLQKPALEAAAAEAGIPFYYCEITQNDYTPGFCGIRAVPTFCIYEKRKALGKLTNSDTDTVCRWIKDTAAKGEHVLASK